MAIALCAFLISLVAVLALLKTPLKRLALDQPNSRSMHMEVTPRTGGLAILSAVIILWLLIEVDWIWLTAIILLFGVSVLDDIFKLGVLKRFAVHLLSAFIFIHQHITDISWIELSVLMLGLIWITNLYNFMDGSDGMAGGMTFVGFGAYAIAAYTGNNLEIAAMAAAICGSIAAFLLFNFHPARIFMGDAGSIPLGFLAGSIGLFGWDRELWPLWFPLLVFSPFLVDATATLIRRLLKRESFWQAHKDHYYQRLIRMGWSHRKTALAAYALMLAVAGSALMLLGQAYWIICTTLAVWMLIYLFFFGSIDKMWWVQRYGGE